MSVISLKCSANLTCSSRGRLRKLASSSSSQGPSVLAKEACAIGSVEPGRGLASRSSSLNSLIVVRLGRVVSDKY
jgi:hypothetical protein